MLSSFFKQCSSVATLQPSSAVQVPLLWSHGQHRGVLGVMEPCSPPVTATTTPVCFEVPRSFSCFCQHKHLYTYKLTALLRDLFNFFNLVRCSWESLHLRNCSSGLRGISSALVLVRVFGWTWYPSPCPCAIISHHPSPSIRVLSFVA